jgi:AcrR family transcriptional regulator
VPRHFEEEDRETIRTELLGRGAELFSRYGFRKTGVDEVARLAGVSKGSFYSFFDSKEDFFVEILLETERKIRETLEKNLFSSELPVKEAFVDALFRQLMYLRNTPVLHILTKPEEYHFLFRKLGPEQRGKLFAADEEYVIRLLQEAGNHLHLREVDPPVLTGALRGISLLVMHREEIGEPVFEDSLRLILTAVADYLFPDGDTSS